MSEKSLPISTGFIWAIIAAVVMIWLAPMTMKSKDYTTEKSENEMALNKLTSEEERVIVHKGTEPASSGKYDKFSAEGTYTCKQCDAPLYNSSDKFSSNCGWPSFDDEIDGAVKRTIDADGRRTEITCAKCGGHLGHVFLGEQLTDKNIRHCVNSISMNFIPAGQETTTMKAYFAGGCFWGTEHLLKDVAGVLATSVGYMGGRTNNPTYREICSGQTGHAETVEIEYDPSMISYEKLARFFFEIHDPTQVNRQGPDIGDQYRSAMFYSDDNEKEILENLIQILKGKGFDVATELAKAGTYWDGEDYHQDYYAKNGQSPYCHIYQKRF